MRRAPVDEVAGEDVPGIVSEALEGYIPRVSLSSVERDAYTTEFKRRAPLPRKSPSEELLVPRDN